MTNRRDLKVSFNPTIQNHLSLEDARYNSGLPLTQLLNNYITFTANLDSSIKKPLLDFIENEIEARIEIQPNISVIMNDSLKTQINQLLGLKNLLINYYMFEHKKPQMERINLKEGYFQYPKDWILINPEDAHSVMRAYVVECWNASKYNIPHFVFFDDLFDIDEEFKQRIYNGIISIYPEFNEILDRQVEPKYAKGKPECFNSIENKDEYFSAPNILISLIKTSTEIRQIRLSDANYSPPANAMIVK